MSDVIPFRKDDDAKRAALRERRKRDADALVATIADGGAGSFRVFAPRDLGTPTVEIRHPTSLPGPLYITPAQAFDLGRALMDAAKKWQE